MLTTIDIRHVLKILPYLMLIFLLVLGETDARDEDFVIDLPLQKIEFSDLPSIQSATNDEIGDTKKIVPRLRSPQLIPDRHIDRIKRRKGKQKRLCGTEEFWHSRGHKCVPKICSPGTHRRRYDGECVVTSERIEQVQGFSGHQKYRYSGISWKRKQKVVYHGLPPRFGPGMGISGRF